MHRTLKGRPPPQTPSPDHDSMGRFMEPFLTILLWAQKKLYLAKNEKLLQSAYPEGISMGGRTLPGQ